MKNINKTILILVAIVNILIAYISIKLDTVGIQNVFIVCLITFISIYIVRSNIK